MNSLASKHASNVQFMMVYLLEAHASDEWPLGSEPLVPASRSLDQRACNARRFRDEAGVRVPMYLDSMSDSFHKNFAAWPERFFVVSADGTVCFVAQPVPGGYDHDAIFGHIEMVLHGLITDAG